jgi:hypothetical protein
MFKEVNKKYNLRGWSVCTTDESEVHHWDGLKWHEMHTKFYDNPFRHSSNIKVTASTIQDGFMMYAQDSGDMIYILNFMTDSGIQVFWGYYIKKLLLERIYKVCHWDGSRWHDVHTMLHDEISSGGICTSTYDASWWPAQQVFVQYEGCNSAMCMAVILVLLVKGNIVVHCWDELSWHDKHTNFHEDW